MKKLLTILVLLGALAAGGHYAFWMMAAATAEQRLADWAERAKGINDFDISYRVEKSGWPTTVRLALHDITLRQEIPNNMIIKQKPGSAITLELASLFDMGHITGQQENLGFTMSLEENGQRADIDVSLGRVDTDARVEGDTHKIVSELTDMRMTMRMDGRQMMTMALPRAFSRQERLAGGRPGTVNENVLLNAENLEIAINIPEQGRQSFTMDHYIIKGSTENFPADTAYLQSELRELLAAMKAQRETLNLAGFKLALTDFMEQMVAKGSRINIQQLDIKISGFPQVGSVNFHLDGQLGLDSQSRPEGTLNIALSGLEQLATQMPQDPQQAGMPPFLAAMAGSGEMKVSLSASNGMVAVNGAPMLPAPPLRGLLAQMPASLDKSALRPQPPMGMENDMEGMGNMPQGMDGMR